VASGDLYLYVEFFIDGDLLVDGKRPFGEEELNSGVIIDAE
jgi:hypothetical protein